MQMGSITFREIVEKVLNEPSSISRSECFMAAKPTKGTGFAFPAKFQPQDRRTCRRVSRNFSEILEALRDDALQRQSTVRAKHICGLSLVNARSSQRFGSRPGLLDPKLICSSLLDIEYECRRPRSRVA